MTCSRAQSLAQGLHLNDRKQSRAPAHLCVTLTKWEERLKLRAHRYSFVAKGKPLKGMGGQIGQKPGGKKS